MFAFFEELAFSRAQTIGLFVMVVAVALASLVGFYPIFLMQVMCYALFAVSTNLLLGFIGLLSLGQAAYFGLGAYIAGYTMQTWGWTPEVALALAGLGGATLGAAFGWLVIRRTAIAFAMITLALAQIANFFATEATGFTGGENGIQNIPRGALFGVFSLSSDTAMYVVVAVIFVAGVLFIHRILHSPFGQVVKSIRMNEPRTVSLGYKPEHYKWIVFILAGAVAGLAGGLKAVVMGIATLSDIGNTLSGLVVLMVLVGGIGTVFGPIVGALVVVSMQYYLAPFGAWIIVIQGLIFIACVLTFRRGIIGELGARFRVAL